MSMVERNPGGNGEAEEVVIRDPLRSDTARRRRVSHFPAAAAERRLPGFACLPRCARLGPPQVSPEGVMVGTAPADLGLGRSALPV